MPTAEQKRMYNERYREKLKQRKEQKEEQQVEQKEEEVEEMGSRENATSYSEEEEENDLITVSKADMQKYIDSLREEYENEKKTLDKPQTEEKKKELQTQVQEPSFMGQLMRNTAMNMASTVATVAVPTMIGLVIKSFSGPSGNSSNQSAQKDMTKQRESEPNFHSFEGTL